MRTLRRSLAMLVLASLLLVSTACPKVQKGDVLPYAREVSAGLKDTEAILLANGITSQLVGQARVWSEKLVTELEKPDSPDSHTTRLQILSTLITKFEELVAETNRISNPRTKTLVLIGLAISNAALRRISSTVAQQTPTVAAEGRASMPASVVQVNRFAQRPQWRCRSSQTGRFEKMEFCKAHPDASTVETYY